MEQSSDVVIRDMVAEDYDEVYRLWTHIHGFGLRSIDDSREGVTRFLRRNPTTSVVAERDGRIVGSILCGHDGRQATFYHVCVDRDCRKQGIATKMVKRALLALREEGISKVMLVAFVTNEVGNTFWQKIGWTPRRDFNSYEFKINEANITKFVE
jgi:ribosomal protein S18 acetylase RimI-like enzyme